MRDLHAAARPSRAYGRRPGAVGTLVVFSDADGVERSRTWPNALPGHKSPCRVDSSKGLRQHRCSPAHRDLEEGYRTWRQSWEDRLEAAAMGYATEEAEFRAAN